MKQVKGERSKVKGKGLKTKNEKLTENARPKGFAFYLLPLTFYLVFTLLPFTFNLLPSVCFADGEVARIQKAYENIKDVRGDFVQKGYIRDLKRTDTYSGQFFIKPPKIKWEFRGDKPQVVYVNGEDLLIYQKKEKQVFRTKFDRATYGQAPIALLGGFGDINKEFDASMKKGRLILKPKKRMGSVTEIEITLSDGVFPIEQLTVLDTASNRIDITLKNVRVNTGLGEKIFEFTPPEGVTVIQQ
ncbi:MAG: outer membrane lipoprotein carrier protein LolA [Nitrospirae bacterium]|nr:outer membrane lipoprotein carrier protein LolA [Nitrospirota bacterium]